jgi:Mn-dependent DtxR family transcriptional regulator
VIKENSTIKQEEIAKIIGKSLRTVKTRMIEMQKKSYYKKNRKKKWRIGSVIL